MSSKNGDIFADIGGMRIEAKTDRETLEFPVPPTLPGKRLPAATSDPKAAFRPAARIDTAEKLAVELDRQRRKHAPFMKDLAPPLPSLRIQQRLDRFQWRLETDRDRSDFRHTADGKGKWEEVAIPHYGGPTGRAVAWYRTVFTVSREMLDKGAFFVRFGAVDYKAHVFVNQHFLGSHEGFFGSFAFECAAHIREGENILLVKVENDAVYLGNQSWKGIEEGDKLYAATGPGWDDSELGWHHCPPGMGIYQDVYVEACAPLSLSDLFVRPVPLEERAEAWVEVYNTDRTSVPASFEIAVFGQNFRKTVIRRLRHSPNVQVVPGVGDMQKATDHQCIDLLVGAGANCIRIPLEIPTPRLWSPDTPWLYQLQVKLLDSKGGVIDTATRQFGMRSFHQDTVNKPKGRFYLNNREIKLRGANTMGFEQQDVMKKDFEQLRDDILLAKICHMNFLRLTQRPVQREIYEICDRLGMMTQTDLPLFGCMRFNKVAEGVRQAEEMERLVRGYACNILVSYINEPFPNASAKPHRHLRRNELQHFFEMCDRAVCLLNPDRVTKHVDGDYDPPGTTLPDNHCYCGWYNGHGLELGKLHRGYWIPVHKGWAYACGEFGAEGLDPVDLMRRRYPASWLPAGKDRECDWSPDRIITAQTGKFHYMWFDTQHTMEDWVRISQRHQAWVTRLFAENFRRENRMVSFAIHLFIDAFPSGWMKAIMDCERRPKPAFFTYRDALEPLNVSIRTDRWAFFSGERMPFEFWVCNDTHAAPDKLALRWQIEQDGTVIFAQRAPATIEAMQATFQGTFAPRAPQVKQRTAYTLRLSLAGKLDTAITYDVFPGPARVPKTLRVAALGTGTLLREMNIAPLRKMADADVIVIDDIDAYRKKAAAVDRAVAAGARAIFLDLPAGEHVIGGECIQVESCIMAPRQFVSRATGHPLVEGFAPDDFKCWYDPAADCFRPLLTRMFRAGQAWRPVLLSGNGGSNGNWESRLAAAERPSGKGAFHICQVALIGRTQHNPVAARFAHNMLTGEEK